MVLLATCELSGYFVIVEGFHFEELVAVAIAVFNL